MSFQSAGTGGLLINAQHTSPYLVRGEINMDDKKSLYLYSDENQTEMALNKNGYIDFDSYSNSPKVFKMGWSRSGNQFERSNAMISELIYVTDDLTAIEQAAITNYLAEKWQLTTVADSDLDGIVDSDDTETPKVKIANDVAIIQTPYMYEPGGYDMDIGDTITYTVTNQPSWTTFDSSTGRLTGTPSSSDMGGQSIKSYSGISMTVTDADGESAVLPSFTIDVVSNDLPVANDMSINIDEDTSGTITLQGTDLNGYDLIYSVTNVTNGLATFNYVSNTVEYAGDVDYFGSDSFTYKVTNEYGLESSEKTVSITVDPVNDAPRLLQDPSLDINIAGIDDIVLWLDATNIDGANNDTLTDGDYIGTWTDLSGNGNHATQSDALLQPAYSEKIYRYGIVDGGLDQETIDIEGVRFFSENMFSYGVLSSNTNLNLLTPVSDDFTMIMVAKQNNHGAGGGTTWPNAGVGVFGNATQFGVRQGNNTLRTGFYDVDFGSNWSGMQQPDNYNRQLIVQLQRNSVTGEVKFSKDFIITDINADKLIYRFNGSRNDVYWK